MKPTFQNRLEIEPDDTIGMLSNYADVYGLIDAPDESIKQEDTSLTADEFSDYLDGFDTNRRRAMSLMGENIDQQSRQTQIEEVLKENG